jgi:hypothetical protein
MATACNQRAPRTAAPLAPRAQHPGESVDISAMSATVRNADSTRPHCPVYPHAEASLTVSGVNGLIQYRWERSDSTMGPLYQVTADSAKTKPGAMALQPDDWTDNRPGVQLTVEEYVHVLYPFDVRSAPVSINAKCY